jgi:hypothetical protein
MLFGNHGVPLEGLPIYTFRSPVSRVKGGRYHSLSVHMIVRSEKYLHQDRTRRELKLCFAMADNSREG